jgi:glutathione S-transferase
MKLYSAPLSCSLASHIALIEAGIPAEYAYVVLSKRQTIDGDDYLSVSPKGQVPALRLDDGELLTEGPAVLQWIADQNPGAKLAPAAGTMARYRLQEWLNYLATEVHKMVFATIFNPFQPAEAKSFAREVVAAKFDHLSKLLEGRTVLMGDDFTVADAYLVTILNWCQPAGIDLSRWPVLVEYHRRHVARPSVTKALQTELDVRAKTAA